MTKVAILQSNYIPWKGYFDIIHDVDLFVFYDDLQYTKNDWRNRNRIKTPNGADWLTIPVGEDSHRLICDVEIKNPLWQTKHWKTSGRLNTGRPFSNTIASVHTLPATGLFLKKFIWGNTGEVSRILIST